MKIKTSELSGIALDFAVARALDYKPVLETENTGPDFWICQVPWGGYEMIGEGGFSPSTNWSQGGPLVDRFGMELAPSPTGDIDDRGEWSSRAEDEESEWYVGHTALIAICRAIVGLKLGNEVDVPEEFL